MEYDAIGRRAFPRMITESAVDSIGITFLIKVYSRGVSGRSALLRKSIQSYRLPKARYGWWHIVSHSTLAEHGYCTLANKTIVRADLRKNHNLTRAKCDKLFNKGHLYRLR